MKKLKLQGPFQFVELELSSSCFTFFSEKSKEMVGVHLLDNEKNRSLVKNRLMKLVRKYDLESFDELKRLLQFRNPELEEQFISQITTNKTEFFREKIHFEFLQSKLREKIDSNQELTIWSAACSTGQEPYSIAIMLSELFGINRSYMWKILATDVDNEVLSQAVNGFYKEDDLATVEPKILHSYFDHVGPYYHLKDQIVEQVHFSKLNLANPSYPIQKKFDAIFCRNVFIYFDEQTKQNVTMRLKDFLKPNGYLFLGLSEAGSIKFDDLMSVGAAIYQKRTFK